MQAAYQLDTTPSYLVQFSRMASSVSGGELVMTYPKDEHDRHKAYLLMTKESYQKYAPGLGPDADS